MLNFTAIDFETANPKRGSVCQVGIARVRDGQIVASAGSYVTPPPGLTHFVARNVDIHGILPHHIQGAPDWRVVTNWLREVTAGDVFVAHNAAFERSVITQASAAVGIFPLTNPFACSMKLAKILALPVPNHKLVTVAQHYDIPVRKHHDAEADAITSAQVMLAMARDHGLTHTQHLIVR